MIVGPDSRGSGWRKKAPSLLARQPRWLLALLAVRREVGSSLHSAPSHHGSQLLLAAIGSKLSTVSMENYARQQSSYKKKCAGNNFFKGNSEFHLIASFNHRNFNGLFFLKKHTPLQIWHIKVGVTGHRFWWPK